MITSNETLRVMRALAFTAQAKRINASLETRGFVSSTAVPAGFVTSARRAQVRSNGYRGPITRADLAKMVK